MIDRLVRFLTTACALEPLPARPGEFLQGGPPRGFRFPATPGTRLALVADGHLEFEVDGLVVDRALGSLGLVHFLSAAPTAQGHAAVLTTVLEQAAHLRHLLALRRLDQPHPMQVQLPSVEVVFVGLGVPAAVQAALRETLRTSLQSSGLLHAISVNLAWLEPLAPAVAAPPPPTSAAAPTGTPLPAPTSPGTVTAAPLSLADTAALRRAFCWLLPATREWFTSLAPAPTPLGAPLASSPLIQPWDEIELTDFRRPGQRRWKKESAARLHVLHGPNGSGKSSLAEGFVYAVTGDSPRLPRAQTPDTAPATLVPLICRHPPAKSAKACVRHTGAVVKQRVVTLEQTPATAATASEAVLPGAALMLDQGLCDRLSNQGPETRARTWLRSFFADLETERDALRATSRRLEAHAQALAPDADLIQIAQAVDTAHQLVGPLLRPPSAGATAPSVMLVDFLRQLFGLPKGAGASPPDLAEVLADFASLGLSLPGVLALTLAPPPPGCPPADYPWAAEEREELFKQLLTAFGTDVPLLESWRAHDLLAQDNLLERLGRDVYDTAETAAGGDNLDEGARAARFNRWLHLVAQTDLLDRARVIAATKATLATLPAGAAGDPLLDDLAPRLAVAEIDARLTAARAERDTLRQQLASLSVMRGETKVARQLRRVGPHELDPLRAAIRSGFYSPWLEPAHEAALLALVRDRRSDALGELRVGAPDWTRPLLELVRSRRQALEFFTGPLVAPESRSQRPGARFEGRATAIIGLVTDAVQLTRLEAGAARQFFQRLEDGPFRASIDEFTAFLTPARWAYDPITSKLPDPKTTEPGSERFEQQSHGLDVAQVLNTAELNTLSLALYLLCAPRVPNPYRVVFLDDPLQNMDELTVGTIARALARLMRLWQQVPGFADWEVVLLLHGEEDCERILMEAEAAHYRIPWLAPHGAPVPAPSSSAVDAPEGENDVRFLPANSTAGSRLLDLGGFLTAARPPAS